MPPDPPAEDFVTVTPGEPAKESGDIELGGEDANLEPALSDGADPPAVEPATEDPPPVEDERNLLRILDEHYGEKTLGQKYATDDDAIRGLINAHHLVGQRDADAELGRALRGKEREILDFLEGKSQQVPLPAPQPPQEGPPDYDPAWAHQVVTDPQTGRPTAAPGAPTDVVSKATQYYEWREKQLDALARNPADSLRPEFEKWAGDIQEQSRTALQAQLGESEERNLLRDWEEKNRNFLYINGNPSHGFTPQAQRFITYHDQLASMGVQSQGHRLEVATQLMAAEQVSTQQPQQAPPPKPTNKAVRQPAVHGGAPQGLTHEDRVSQMDLAEHLRWELDQQTPQMGQ